MLQFRIPFTSIEVFVCEGCAGLTAQRSDMVRRHPQDVSARLLLAASLYESGRFDETIEQCEEVIRLIPDQMVQESTEKASRKANAYYLIGASFVQKERTREACDALRQVLQYGDKNMTIAAKRMLKTCSDQRA
jgi:tetratricopeptide (TPR) repeat protein